MIEIKAEYDPEEDCAIANGHIEIYSRKAAVNEVAAIFTVLFREIPKREFLEGLMQSEFGKDVGL